MVAPVAKAEPSDDKAYVPAMHSFPEQQCGKIRTDFRMKSMRGKRSTTLNEQAERCAERMGLFWLKNTLADLPFDGFAFRPAVIAAVRLIKTRYTIDEDVIIENKFPDEVDGLRSLPLPQTVLRELLSPDTERAGLAPVLYPADNHHGDRVQLRGELPEHPLQ
jgi:hypothetical protein